MNLFEVIKTLKPTTLSQRLFRAFYMVLSDVKASVL